MKTQNFINGIIRIGLVLLIGATIRVELEKRYPKIKDKLPWYLKW